MKKPNHTLISQAIASVLLITALPAIATDSNTDKQDTNPTDKSKTVQKSSSTDSKVETMSEITVEAESNSLDGRPEPVSRTNFATPSTKVTRQEIQETNAVTTADSVKYESGVFARQRYIGDPNAPVGMRGSNPYQGGRVMVFMDGMPIWNPLQSSYNGSPRWGLIGPGEIKSVDVLGGPFSAEYSGNAMGGVINFNTLMPQKREIYTEATYMMQPYQSMGQNTNLQGFKTFGSYGDKFDKFSTYFSYNHIENEGQPMTPTVQTGLSQAKNGLSGGKNYTYTPLDGGLLETNPKGDGKGGNAGAPMLQTGNDGVYHSTDDLYKWKGSYDIRPDLITSFTAAFQNLEVTKTGQSFLNNPTTGKTIWGSQLSPIKTSGINYSGYSSNGYALSNNTAWGTSYQNRETLTLGWGLSGRIFGNWNTNTNVSFFDILKDTTISSSYNPNDPMYNKKNGSTYAGQDSSWDNSGWFNISAKFDNQEFLGRKDLSFATGYEFQHATMMNTVRNLSSVTTNTPDATTPLKTQSGGVLDTHGLFGQLTWRFIEDWDATLGTRLERWNLSDGVNLTSTSLKGALNPQDRQVSAWSPKFSLGYQPGRWKFRYSVGKAYRFPVADELFGNSGSVSGSVSLADSTLKPEDGTHHNFLTEYDFDIGYARLNLFHENVRNQIYSQWIYLPGTTNLSSLISSIGEVETNGIDLTTNFDRIMGTGFDVKLNTTILDSKILKNPMNPAVVGNQFPLMPNYRANLLTTYHYGKDWDFSVGTRYQGKMFSQADNKDLNIPYYGAFTESVYVDLKATYRFSKGGHISAGIDNVNDYVAFYNHPLPLRTFFAQVGYKF